MDRSLKSAEPNFCSWVNPGSRARHKDECGKGKWRGATEHKDNMGTDNPFTMVCMSGFRSASQKPSLEHSFRCRFSSSWRQTQVGSLSELPCQSQYFRSHIAHGRDPAVWRLIIFSEILDGHYKIFNTEARQTIKFRQSFVATCKVRINIPARTFP